MSPKEAALTDPAHRLFLECCYEALETAGHAASPAGRRTAVFAGTGMNLYGYQRPGRGTPGDLTEAMAASFGGQPDFLAARVAYRLGLTGPAVGVQTACSTSLVAVHLAAAALRNGDADLALAGAAAVHQPQEGGYRVHPGSVLSPTGRCRPFDARADGTVGGNGVGVVLLRPLAAAIAADDPIHAVITGSAVNNDGTRKAGFAAPSVSGQAGAIRAALRRAGVTGDMLCYVEAHGTGTALGDPVEFEALSQALRTESGQPGHCALGSVKASIGHLDTCAGMAGLIKVVLMLRHRTQVPTANLERPNPVLALDASPVMLATDVRPLRAPGEAPLRAGVNSLGVGGTNAFVVVQEPPPPPGRPAEAARQVPALLPLSGSTAAMVRETARGLATWLRDHPGLSVPEVVASMAARPLRAERSVVLGRTLAELSGALRALAADEPGAYTTGRAIDGGELRVAFACCGQGRVRRGMGRTIYDDCPAARDVLKECAEVHRSCGGDGLLAALLDEDTEPVPAGLAQPMLFALQVALIAMWRSWGLEPGGVLGQSMGEIAALTAAGALSVADGMRFCTSRGRLMAASAGGMLAVAARPVLAEQIAGQAGLEVAVRSGAEWQVLSGDLAAIARATELLDQRGLPWQKLDVDVAYHSALLDPVLGELSLAARSCHLGPLAVPFISSVDGVLHPAGGTIDRAYLVEQARRQVRLDLAFAALEPAGFGAVVEIGPAHDVSTLGRRAQPALLWLGGGGDAAPRALAQLFCQGAPVDWGRLNPVGRRITLPASALQHTDVSRGPAQVAARPDPVEDGAMNDEKLLTVLALTAGQLGLREEEVGADQSFVELGADSLTLLALAGQVSERYGIRVPVSELFAEAGTPRGLALTVASRTPSQDRTDNTQPAPGDSCDFSIYFFGDYPSSNGDGKYQPLLDAAEFADRAGFHAIWFPERHFHSFGALFPNPSVLGAALAVRTSHIRLNAGSVVLPLHNPIRVAEEWSMVDNLSGGRVGLCLASGWSANDFVLAPESYGRHKQVMYEQLETLRRLWAGERVSVRSGTGQQVEVTTLPRPVQPLPPLFTAVVSKPDSYRQAARNDLGVVTNLMSQSVADLAANIELYRRTRAECGLDPRAGRVVVLVHTYLAQDRDQARREAFGPFCDYLRSSLSLFDGVTNSLGLKIDLERTHPEDVEFLLGRAFSRYCDERALIGSPRSCQPVVQALIDAGADELGCLIDFGVPADRMLDGLPMLDVLRARYAPGAADGGFPLSDAQRRLWLLDKMYPGRDTYHEPRAILLDGPLEPDALCAALTRVVDRHPQLRAVIRDVDGEPRQFIAPAAPVSYEQTAMEGLDVTRALRELVLADVETSLDLAAGPLFLAKLVRLGPERHLLYLLVHHIVFDSLSTAIFCRDLAEYYGAWPGEPDGLPSLPAFGEPSAPADSQRLADGLVFWAKELADAPVLSLPADRPRHPGPSRRAGSVVHEFGAELTDAVAALARRHGCTLFMTLLGALGAVLGRLSGQEDVVLGTAMTSRPAGTEELIGMFVDTVVLRLDLSGEPDAATLLRRVRDRCGQAYEHRDVPFDKLVSVLNPERVAGVNPLFQTMVEFEDAADLAFDPPRLRAEILDVASERAAFDVSFLMTRHAGGLRCTMTYDAGLFDDSTILRMLDYMQACLRRMADDPSARLPELTALTDADRGRLNDLNCRRAEEPPACLHQLFEEQAARTPAAPALTGDEETLSYGELDTAASRLAGVLTGYRVRRNSVVGVCLPRGSALIIALLAVLKAGGAYLPLDPALPGERLREYLAGSSAVLVLADRGVTAEANPFGGVPVHVVDNHGGPAHGQSAEAPWTAEAAEPDDMAYCIYTSGSTGPPKAVAVPHRGPVNLVRWQLRNSEPLRTLWWNSTAFDLSVQEIFTTLASGATLVTIGDGIRGDMAAVGEAMRRHGVQRVFMPFTPLNYLAAEVPAVPSLRELYAGGEQVVITPALRRLLDAHPGVRLFNQYGPTEASVIVTSYEARGDEDGPLPIGRPISNVVIRVLDPDGRPVPVGAIGELTIGGDALATGYLGDPVRTARAFIPDPDCPGQRLYRTGDLVRWRADGELEFRCRNDDQVKIRGYRVSPGEVRWALGRLAGLRDSAVLVCRDRRGEPQLVAYVVPTADAAPELVPMLRDQLRATLPSYLIPGEWVTLAELPTAPNGKLAADRLPEPAGIDGELAGEPPVTRVERRLHELWCAELGVPAIGRQRAFFDCGGSSLTAVRLLSRVRDEFGCQLSLAGFMSEPTIEAMGRTLAGLIPSER